MSEERGASARPDNPQQTEVSSAEGGETVEPQAATVGSHAEQAAAVSEEDRLSVEPESVPTSEPPRTSSPPSVKTTGPLLPMRIIGVNAGPSQPAPQADVSSANTEAVQPDAGDSGSSAGAAPPSMPPPKPPSRRSLSAEGSSDPSAPSAVVGDGLLENANLRPPLLPGAARGELDDGAPRSGLAAGPPLSEVSERRPPPLERPRPSSPGRNHVPPPLPSAPGGPPPLPAERKSSPAIAPPPLPSSVVEPPIRDAAASRDADEPHAGWARADAPTPPETPAVRAELLAAQGFGTSQLAPTPSVPSGPRSDRTKPPALPNRPRRASTDSESPAPPSVDGAPAGEVPLKSPDKKKRQRRLPPVPPPRTGFTGSLEEDTSKRKHWWEEVFNDDFLRASFELTERQLKREVDFIERSLNIEGSGVILDLACGAGRQAVELTRRGYMAVGYDLSVTQLARAGELAQAQGIKVSFLQGDMREMAFEQTFDAVLFWNASFGYFEEEKNVAVLRNVHRSLKPGGSFLLDIPNRDFVVSQQPGQNWFEGDGCVCMDDMHVDFITSRLCVKRTLMLDDGRNKECLYSIRLFGLHELGRMLHEIGFRVNEVSGDVATRGVFMGATSPRLILSVTKR